MKLAELHAPLITEDTLQQIVKRLLKSGETLADVLGDDAALGARLLGGKTTDAALAIRGNSPLSAKMLKSLMNSQGQQTDKTQGTNIKLVKMPGGAKLLVVGKGDDACVITTAHQRDQLVESLTEAKKEDPCWKGYEQVGTKKKNGKTVPNCVPESLREARETSPWVTSKYWPKSFDPSYDPAKLAFSAMVKDTVTAFPPPMQPMFRDWFAGGNSIFDSVRGAMYAFEDFMHDKMDHEYSLEELQTNIKALGSTFKELDIQFEFTKDALGDANKKELNRKDETYESFIKAYRSVKIPVVTGVAMNVFPKFTLTFACYPNDELYPIINGKLESDRFDKHLRKSGMLDYVWKFMVSVADSGVFSLLTDPVKLTSKAKPATMISREAFEKSYG